MLALWPAAAVKPSLKTHLELALGLQQPGIPKLAGCCAPGSRSRNPLEHPTLSPQPLEAVLPGAGQCQCLPAGRQGLLVPQEADTPSHKPVREGSLVWETLVEPGSFPVPLGPQLCSKQTLAGAQMGEEAGMEMVNSCLCLYRAAPGINFLLFHFSLHNLGLHFLTLVFDSFWPVTVLGLKFRLVLASGFFGWFASLAVGELVRPYTESCLVREHPQCSLCTCALPPFFHGHPSPPESFLVHRQGMFLLL